MKQNCIEIFINNVNITNAPKLRVCLIMGALLKIYIFIVFAIIFFTICNLVVLIIPKNNMPANCTKGHDTLRANPMAKTVQNVRNARAKNCSQFNI